MAKSPRNQLVDFEREADAAIEAMPLAAMPARALMTHLATTIFLFLHAEGPKDPSVWKTGDTLTYRISYLLPWLRGRKAGPLGANAADNLQAIREQDPKAEDVRNLLAYAHFCEVMPDVHRRRLEVELIENGFRLVHPSPDYAVMEATDIIVSELALNHLAVSPKRLPDEEIFELAKTAPKFDERILTRVLARREEFYRTHVREAPLVDDGAMVHVFGFDRARFAQIQSAIFAIADVFMQIGLVLWIWTTKESDSPSDEALEWVTPCWIYAGFLDMVAKLSGASQAEIERFVEQFTLDFNQPADRSRGGDGFTPPFYRLEDSILFVPDLILRYCHPRNALASLPRLDPKLFDDLISASLEPTLIDEIAQAFDGIGGIIVRKNVTFDGGEFDLVVADEQGTNVVICEVKAPLPPQGSRPTQRLAGRIQEGLDQIDAARAMDPSVRAKILSDSLGLDVSGAAIDYLIVARSCFGKVDVWAAGAATVPGTLPLIRLALARLRASGGNPARELPNTLRALTAEIIGDAKFSWIHGAMPLFGRTVETPQLLYDNAAVDAWMRQAVEAVPA